MMAGVLGSVHYFMYQYWEEQGDPLSSKIFLTKYGLYMPIMTMVIYYLLVTRIIPSLLQNRDAFQLKWVLVGFNMMMVLINLYFFTQTFIHYNYGMDMFDFDFPRKDVVRPGVLKKISLCNLYLWTKYLDLFDTIFFALRKKQSQITNLHLYHHISVPTLGWIVLRIIPSNGPIVIFPIFNTFIHVVMYTYYSMAALGPTLRPYLWWKKYLTLIQIYQFVIYAVFSWIFAYKQRGYPLYMQILGYTQPIIFLVLFIRFYISSYKKSEPSLSQKNLKAD